MIKHLFIQSISEINKILSYNLIFKIINNIYKSSLNLQTLF